MKNVMTFNGHKAVIEYDPEIDMFRGEFLGLSGGADFYAADVESLKKEGETSLRIYLDECQRKGREPYRNFSGTFNVRVPKELHEAAVTASASQGISLNQFVAQAIRNAANH